jgi:hypothetical protein
MEVLNELAFERFDEPLLEGVDVLEVNQHVLREMLA